MPAAGGRFTGAALNPARVLGPALVFNCYWNTAFVYMAAQFLGALVAALVNIPLYGPGPEFGGTLGQGALETELSGGRHYKESQGLLGSSGR